MASVFAEEVRQSLRRLNRNGEPHREYGLSATMPWQALEDADAFHIIAEHIRLNMIETLRATGAPINVWRAGQQIGYVASNVSVYTGEGQEWRDEHHFRVRARVSTETPPFTHPESEAL